MFLLNQQDRPRTTEFMPAAGEQFVTWSRIEIPDPTKSQSSPDSWYLTQQKSCQYEVIHQCLTLHGMFLYGSKSCKASLILLLYHCLSQWKCHYWVNWELLTTKSQQCCLAMGALESKSLKMEIEPKSMVMQSIRLSSSVATVNWKLSETTTNVCLWSALESSWTCAWLGL